MSERPEEEPSEAAKLMSALVNMPHGSLEAVRWALGRCTPEELREVAAELVQFVWEKDECARANSAMYFDMAERIQALQAARDECDRTHGITVVSDDFDYSISVNGRLLATTETRQFDCLQQWPECSSGEYNPACCRFPKSCSVAEVAPYRVRWNDDGYPSLYPEADDPTTRRQTQ